MIRSDRRVLVCYVPGLDLRRISDAVTPTIAKLIGRYSRVEISTLPDTELVPTLLSGVYPHQNQIWQVSLGRRQRPTAMQRLIDHLPDLVTTTAQCIRQKFDPDFDLAAIPPRRRREFIQHRFKYTRRAASPSIMAEFNGYKSLFGLLESESRYTFTKRFDALDSIAREIFERDLRLEFLEMYALDLYQHWHLDHAAGMREALGRTDRFVATLRDGCARNGCTLVLLADHGQEPVKNVIPVVQTLRRSGVPQANYSYYCELACTRLWFHTEDARDRLTAMLEELPSCSLLHFSEMHQSHVCFDDSRFGEYYLMADAGSVFFPHDFYQPFANLYLGLSDHSQRKRIFNPIHRGNHGYLPHHPSEKGFLVLADEHATPNRENMTLIDFAPTMLAYLGVEIPAHMSGRSVVSQ
ncbi:MAG: alkaline phosphatase family protein [Deltaproteobacteria bacterium]|jgi:hypothetical protein|nr:alkaline phosphatase family protein [Deltaproteobacteria bacterium]MBW2541937.1 alkaline phosphatase family protein [Deltaproteobacteria bacterium]